MTDAEFKEIELLIEKNTTISLGMNNCWPNDEAKALRKLLTALNKAEAALSKREQRRLKSNAIITAENEKLEWRDCADRAEAALQQSREECKALKWQVCMDGHDQPCEFCGEKTNTLAANPSEWSVIIGHKRYCHLGCLEEKLAELSSLQSRLDGGVEVRACGAPVTEDQHFPLFDRHLGQLLNLKPGEIKSMLLIERNT